VIVTQRAFKPYNIQMQKAGAVYSLLSHQSIARF